MLMYCSEIGCLKRSISFIRLVTDFLGIPRMMRSAENLISAYPGLPSIGLRTPKGASAFGSK